MKHVENLANQVVSNFTAQEIQGTYRKLVEATKGISSEEVLLSLVKDVNSWIAFLDLADSYPRFRVVLDQNKRAIVEIFYP